MRVIRHHCCVIEPAVPENAYLAMMLFYATTHGGLELLSLLWLLLMSGWCCFGYYQCLFHFHRPAFLGFAVF